MPKLFMLLIGGMPPGRHTEQHDVFFGIGESIRDLIPDIMLFWPEAQGKLHIDAWREVTQVNGYTIKIMDAIKTEIKSDSKLFFINLGGYKQGEFEEFHYKMIIAAKNMGEAISYSKQTAFFKHNGFEGATSHVDDKYGVDVDDVFEIKDILTDAAKKQFSILVTPDEQSQTADEIHLGYFKLNSF